MVALALAAASLAPAIATAQSVRVVPPACAPAWWDPDAFRSALAVELVALEASIADGGDTELSVELACEGEGERATLRVRREDREVVREVDLRDVAPAVRARTLALFAYDALAEERALPVPEADAEIPRPPPEAPRIPAPRAALERRASLLGDPGAAPPPAPRRLATLSLRARATILGGPTVALGPAIELEIAVPDLPLALLAAADGAYAVATDALGEARGLWVDAGLGARALADLGPVRLEASIVVVGGYLRIEGASSREGVVVAARDAPGLAVDGTISAAIVPIPELRIGLLAGVRGWVVGLEGRAAGRRLLSFVEAAPFVELGVGLTP